jgi:lipopolysaccharide export system permease protein
MVITAPRLSRYLMFQVLVGIGLVSFLLVGLYTLVDLLREARSLEGEYQSLQMMVYLAQTMPRRLYDIFPFAALIGVMLGLGGLASGNELVAMRAAGFDRGRILSRVLLAVALCALLLLAVAEWWIPALESEARADREQARSGQIQHNRYGALWLRDQDHMLRVGLSIWLDDSELVFGEVQVYELDERGEPVRIHHAERARHDDTAWELFEVRSLSVAAPEVVQARDSLRFDSDLRPELFAATISRPRLLSLRDLSAMQSLLERNGLDASRYVEAFWERLYFPLNVLAMVLIGLPFVFAGMRQRNPGLNLFIGVSVGLVFFVLTRLAQGVAGVLPLPLGLTLALPALSITLLAVALLGRR